MRNPCHPGEIIREEIVTPLGLTVGAAAKVLGVSRQALSALCNERAGLSPEMAIRIEKAFGTDADHLMRIQLAFDMAQARQSAEALMVGPFQRPAER